MSEEEEIMGEKEGERSEETKGGSGRREREEEEWQEKKERGRREKPQGVYPYSFGIKIRGRRRNGKKRGRDGGERSPRVSIHIPLESRLPLTARKHIK